MLNRLIALPLGLMSCGWLGLALITAKGPEKIASWLALVASIVMAAGTAAEFWFFSDQPYGIWTNGRMASFMSFFVASLILYGCATLIGLRLLRSGANPRLGPIALAAAIPLFFANVIWLNVNFLIPALLAVVVGSMLYIPGNSDRVSQRNPVSTDG
jgi:fucose 4-O-acetylase-like acetyltransferase